MTNVFYCCICGEFTEGYGNNPEGAVWKDMNGNVCEPQFKQTDRCCDKCDNQFVIPGRMYKLAKYKGAK